MILSLIIKAFHEKTIGQNLIKLCTKLVDIPRSSTSNLFFVLWFIVVIKSFVSRCKSLLQTSDLEYV